jgi:predicted RNA-binding protein YlqC (UPF0109 family)
MILSNQNLFFFYYLLQLFYKIDDAFYEIVINANNSDIGKLIGKNGNMINAIKTILNDLFEFEDKILISLSSKGFNENILLKNKFENLISIYDNDYIFLLDSFKLFIKNNFKEVMKEINDEHKNNTLHKTLSEKIIYEEQNKYKTKISNNSNINTNDRYEIETEDD